MKTSAFYYFDSKTKMNDWIEATASDHHEQAEIENDIDFHMHIVIDDCVKFYDSFNSYFPTIDGGDWPETGKFSVVV